MNVNANNKNLMTSIWFHALLLVNFFIPSFNQYLSETGQAGFILVSLLGVTLMSLALLELKVRHKWSFDGFEKFIFFVFFIYMMQIAISAFANPSIVVSDFFEFIRPLIYFLATCFGYNLVKYDHLAAEDIIDKVAFYSVAVVLMGILSAFLLNYGGRELMAFYVKHSLIPGRRFVGTFNNPYDFSLLLGLCFPLFFARFAYKGQLSVVFYFAILFLASIFSQSKNVIGVLGFAFVFCASTYYLFYEKDQARNQNSTNVRILFILGLLVAAGVYFYINFGDQFSYLINGVRGILLGDVDKSTSMRLEQLITLKEYLYNNPLMVISGFGSMKALDIKFESLYMLYIFRYGLLGLFLIFLYSLLPFLLCLLQGQSVNIRNNYRLVLCVFFASVLVAGVGNNVIDQNRVSIPFFMIWGVFWACYLNSRRKS
ncbi:hypothetical protein [Idiomarina sp.]|uniref:hypothetical protein n=1 Tax=Idiomarina sp. TaxID=1874361 RepID=UPI002E9DC6C8|nr:hypothetical protein [Pseudomonadota bacterium]